MCAGSAGRTDEDETLIIRVEDSQLSAAAKAELLTSLANQAASNFSDAANEALGVFFEVTVDPPGPPPGAFVFSAHGADHSMAMPGQTFHGHGAALQSRQNSL